jgi:flagellar basal-body rod protein FlgC
MNLFGVLNISGSALLAQRQRAEVIASNLANAETTETPEGGPYRRQRVVFRTAPASPFSDSLNAAVDQYARGVRIARVVADTTPPDRRYDPGNPHADASGYVSYPAVNPIEEMTNLMGAARSYQMNATVVQTTKQLIQQSLELLR